MLVPIEDEYQVAYENVHRKNIKKHGYSPMTPRMMGRWWMDETGLKLVYDDLHGVLCIEFDDYRDATWFLLKYSS